MESALHGGTVARSAAAWLGAVLAFGLVLGALTRAAGALTTTAGSPLVTGLSGVPVDYSSGPDFPWPAWSAFAQLSLLVVVCGWAGRRWLGALVAVLSLLLAGTGSAVPHVLAPELWAALDEATAATGGAPGWPLRLALVVQTGLLVAPLLVVPAVRPSVPAGAAVVRLLPAAAVATVLGWVAMENPSAEGMEFLLVAVPMAVAVVGLVVTGAGPRWFRIPAGIVSVSAVWSSWLSAQGFGWQSGAALTAVLMAAGAAVVGWLLLLRQLRRQPEAVAAPAR